MKVLLPDSGARKKYLFDKAVKEVASVRDIDAINGHGVSISVKASDYPLMLEIQKN